MALLLWIAVITAIIIDIADRLPVENAVGLTIGTAVLPHCVLIVWYVLEYDYCATEYIIPLCVFAAHFSARTAFKPYRVQFKKAHASLRVRAMYGGKILLKFTAVSLALQTAFYVLAVKNDFWGIPEAVRIADTIVTAVMVIGYGLNGVARIFFLCRRLGIVKRVIAFLLLPVPAVNIFVLGSLYRAAKAEYDYETTRAVCDSQRVESLVCGTKYPILLVHGFGFRDWRYFNYWGRIPAELIKNGAKIYYGHQEAFATVDYNAQLIRNKVMEIVNETGCEKVNIIAHSKGGLDSRYAIAKLGIEDHVASLTTVGTPHRGSEVADYAERLPDSIYRSVADFMDKKYRSFGDKNPDFYTACHQFGTAYAAKFNEEIKDSEKVYVQSYTSVMKNFFSFDVLGFTYLLLIKHGRNDGLVTVESAKWGEFKGVFESRKIRGISHGDTIDLKREDYHGFDPRETYVQIVSELNEMGF